MQSSWIQQCDSIGDNGGGIGYRKKRKTAYVILTIGCLLMVGIAVATVASSNSRRNRTAQSDVSVTATPGITAELTGVVVQTDIQKEKLVLRQLDSNLETSLYYDSSSQMTNKFGELITGDQITTGEIIRAEYRRGEAMIVTAGVPQDVWEYDEVDSFTFQSEDSMMKLAGKKYQYSNNTYIASQNTDAQSGDRVIELTELSDSDRLTVRGVGYKVYSIIRTAGHGYIRLANYEDFAKGMVEVGSSIILPITDNMLLTVPEGVHRVTLCKGKAVATKSVTVQADKEVTADFSDYVSVVENVGMITFQIEPDGADLTINGTTVDYSQPVALNYGEYRINVSMNGYDTYTGTLDVEDPAKEVHIDLIEAEASVVGSATATPAAGATASPTSSASTSSQTTDSSQTVTKTVDSDHTITVTAPRGAEVYLDNVYKGLAPCKFTKVIGSQTITLSQSGYVTKSYSVDILDDDEDVTLKFADLVAESKG